MSYLNNFRTELKTKLMKNQTKKKSKDVALSGEGVNNNEVQNKINNMLSKNLQNLALHKSTNKEQKVVTNNSAKTSSNVARTLVSGPEPDATPSDDPVQKLKELEERYELLEFYDVPDSLNLEKKEVPVYDEEGTKKKLKSKYDSEYGLMKDTLETDYKNAILDLTQDKETASNLAKQKEDSINSTFDAESMTLENQAIKRGLARSSIILGQLSRVESDRANSLLENMNNLESSLASIESEIQDKKTELDSALEKLDIEKADKIEEELEKAYNEYKEMLDDVIEFNNNVNKLEAEYKIKYEQAKTEYKDSVLDLTKYGYDEYKKKLEISKYDYMISYLSQFDKDDAFEIFFRNNNFKDLLGEYYYQKIVDYLYSRL